jgi:hypothetical protein
VTKKGNGNGGKKPSADISPIKMQEMQLTASEILMQGEEASRLLDSPIYNLAHRSVVQNLQDEWVGTSPHETAKREGLYQRVQAVSMVAAEMAMMIARAQNIEDDELANERKLQLAYDENTGF